MRGAMRNALLIGSQHHFAAPIRLTSLEPCADESSVAEIDLEWACNLEQAQGTHAIRRQLGAQGRLGDSDTGPSRAKVDTKNDVINRQLEP